jgi:hypothetical protein
MPVIRNPARLELKPRNYAETANDGAFTREEFPFAAAPSKRL